MSPTQGEVSKAIQGYVNQFSELRRKTDEVFQLLLTLAKNERERADVNEAARKQAEQELQEYVEGKGSK